MTSAASSPDRAAPSLKRAAATVPEPARVRAERRPARVAPDRPVEPAARTVRGVGRSLTDEAYAQLEEMIVTMQLRPGSAVSEATLSERLGIGRTPIREALQRLAREHLVVVLPQRGNLVSEIDVKRQLRLLEVRREVERLIVRCAARRSTREERDEFAQLAASLRRAAAANDARAFVRDDKRFNDLCLSAARNEFAASAMSLMHGLSRRFWYLHYRQAADLPVAALLHADTAHAIAIGDEAAAARALDALLDNIEAFTRATVSTDF